MQYICVTYNRTVNPHQGIIKWSGKRVHDRFAGALSALIVVPLMIGVISAFITIPAHPSAFDRIMSSAIAILGSAAIVATGIYVYSLLRAPFEQRNILREETISQTAELAEIRDSAFEALHLVELEQIRTPSSLNSPMDCARLQLALGFQNDCDLPLKFVLKEVAVEIDGARLTLPVANDPVRIAPDRIEKCVTYINITPPHQGEMVGILDYYLWYGPLSCETSFGQRSRIRFTNSGSSPHYSFVNLPGTKNNFVRTDEEPYAASAD